MRAKHLFFEFDSKGDLGFVESALFSDSCLRVFGGNQSPPVRLLKHENKIIIIQGHPILEGIINDDKIVQKLIKFPNINNLAQNLDGSFLIIIYDINLRSISIINDRFSGFSLFIKEYKKGNIVAGQSFRDVLIHARANGDFELSKESLIVFIWLRKLLGEDTFVKGINFLKSASILTITPNKTESLNYWQPNFEISSIQRSKLVFELAESLRAAVSSHMSDEKRFGLFLSGGLDSRAILAAAPFAIDCFTTSLLVNNESEIARNVSKIKGANYHFLSRRLSFLDKRLDEATALSGMQVFNEAQFLGYEDKVIQHADVLFVGLGLDIFFGGLYLPKKPSKFFGKEALHHEMLSIPKNFSSFFMDNVKYRLITSDPASVLKDQYSKEMRGIVEGKVKEIQNRGQFLGASGLKLWEFMHSHNFSRHYSFPMLSSVRSFAECRAPALSNRLFDLANEMDPYDKIDGEIYQKAITLISPSLMRLRNANSNLPAGWSLKRQTLAKAALYPFYKLGFTKLGTHPHWTERSWPKPSTQLAGSPNLIRKVLELPNCQNLEATGIFSMDKIKIVINEHFEKRHDHTVLINQLLTISSVLRPAEKIELETLCVDLQ